MNSFVILELTILALNNLVPKERILLSYFHRRDSLFEHQLPKLTFFVNSQYALVLTIFWTCLHFSILVLAKPGASARLSCCSKRMVATFLNFHLFFEVLRSIACGKLMFCSMLSQTGQFLLHTSSNVFLSTTTVFFTVNSLSKVYIVFAKSRMKELDVTVKASTFLVSFM